MKKKQSKELPVLQEQGTDDEMLHHLQHETFAYFIDERAAKNGLIADKTMKGSPASIAVTGMGLTVFIIGTERGYISRDDAALKILETLRFFYNSHQGPEPDATGYKGFYYHFLDMDTGKRTWQSELSTIDTAILMAGIIAVRQYFSSDNEKEKEIRTLAKELYERVDWQWALNGKHTLCHGWKPESGFLQFRWENGYSEAHILYILAMGSPTHPIDAMGYNEWIATFEWKKIYDIDFLYAGPLFIHQMSQLWLDMKGIRDAVVSKCGIDYFENSRRAVLVQQQYAIHNPLAFERYGRYVWGISASDGPGPDTKKINGIERIFYNYLARGAPYGPDDGTLSPWAVVASLPFAPDIVLDTIRHMIERLSLVKKGNHGFHASFNPTYPKKGNHPYSWVSRWQFGLNQGSVVIMIENYWSNLIWETFKKSPCICQGLRKAGFTGGWLETNKQ